MRKNFIFYITPHSQPLVNFINTSYISQYDHCNLISYSQNIAFALFNTQSSNSLILSWTSNNNFYDDNKEIRYLKSIPTTTFYFSPIRNRIIKIVMCEGVIHCITNNSQIYTWGNDANDYGLYGNNENIFYDTPTINKKLNSLKIFDIYSGFRHCCGRDFNNNLYIWGYYFGSKPKIIDNKVRLFNCGNDCVIYCKENEKHILNYYNNKNQNIQKIDIGNDSRDIFCGNTIIVVKTYKEKILVVNEFGIHQIHYYYKNGFKIDNLAVRYNEIFVLLSNNKNEQLLLRYSPSNENNFTKTTFEFYERLYKVNLKKKIKLIYSTSSHYINGIFFEIDCEEKEKNTYELKKDKIFTLINRNYKEKKVSITKIKDLSEEQKNVLSNMNNMENDWEGKKRNYSLESQSMINDLKNRNSTISYEDFFNGTAISEKTMNGIRNLSYIKIKENPEDENERRRKRLEQLRLKRERAKKIEEDEINKLKKISDEKNKKKREEERKRQLELEKKRREEEEKKRKIDEENKQKQLLIQNEIERKEKLRIEKENEEKRKKLEEEKMLLMKKKEEEERERQKKEDEKQRKLDYINSIKIQNSENFLINDKTNETLLLKKKNKNNLKLEIDKINFEVSILSNNKTKKRLSKGINTNTNTLEKVSTVDNFTIFQNENNNNSFLYNKQNLKQINENKFKIIKKEIEIEIDKEKEKVVENKKAPPNEINFNLKNTFLKLDFNSLKEKKKIKSLDFTKINNITSYTKRTQHSINDDTKRNFSPLSQNELTSNISKSLIYSSNLKSNLLRTEREKNDNLNNILSINHYLTKNSKSCDNIYNYSMNKKNNLNLTKFEYISPIDDKYYKKRKVFYLNNDSNNVNNLNINSEQNRFKSYIDKYTNLNYQIQLNEQGNKNEIMPPNPYLSVLEAREHLFCNK